MTRSWCGLTAVLVLLAAPVTRAQTEDARAALDEGIAAYEDGRFAEAVDHLERAARGEGLGRADVVRLLGTRVLVAQALGDASALDTALLQLVTLDPVGLGNAASPALAGRTEQALRQTGGATLAIDLEHRTSERGLLVRARLRGDVGALTRHVRLRAREGGGAWTEGVDGEVTLSQAEAADVEVVAIAVGPGGAPLASVGTEEAPHGLVRSVPAAALETSPRASDGGDDGVLIGVLVAVGIAAVAAAIVIGVVVSEGSGQVAVGRPVVEW